MLELCCSHPFALVRIKLELMYNMTVCATNTYGIIVPVARPGWLALARQLCMPYSLLEMNIVFAIPTQRRYDTHIMLYYKLQSLKGRVDRSELS